MAAMPQKTVIETKRREYLLKSNIPAVKKLFESPDL
jgi:hypothetical protein